LMCGRSNWTGLATISVMFSFLLQLDGAAYPHPSA
jgi:hypothetical protein